MKLEDEEILDPLKNLTIEITQRYVSEIIKEATKQAIHKQGIKLSESQFLKFEEKIQNLSDNEKIEHLKEPLEEIKQNISQEGIKSEESLSKFSETLSEGFESKIPLGLSVASKAAIAISILAIVGSTIFFLYPGANEQLSVIVPGLTPANSTNITEKGNCTVCNGTGLLVCSACDGTGVIKQIRPTSPDNYIIRNCSVCLGRQKVQCYACKGDGIIGPNDPGP